jgi:hypothetical protein
MLRCRQVFGAVGSWRMDFGVLVHRTFDLAHLRSGAPSIWRTFD